MSGSNLSRELQAYYAARCPSNDTRVALARLACAASQAPVRPARRRRWGGYALAACVTLAVAGNFYLLSAWRAARHELDRVRGALVVAEQRAAEAAATHHLTPRLVAVRTIMDGCPFCPPLEPVFAELAGRFADEPVLFLTRDITSPESRARWDALAEALDIDWLTPKCRYSGTIQLADREQREVLQLMQRREQLPEMEDAFVRALLHPR